MPTHAARHRRIAQALISTAQADLPASPNPYVTRHLSGHVAEADTWPDLAAAPDLLDHLDPNEVAADALRTAFGRADLPTEIHEILMTRATLAETPVPDRFAVRALASLRLGRAIDMAGATFQRAAWRPRWANLRVEHPHALLTGHAGAVNAVATVRLPDERVLLVSGSVDGSVRLWDPLSAQAVGEPLTGHSDGVTSVAELQLRDGPLLVASGSFDGTIRLWNPISGQPVGEPLIGHTGEVNTLAAVPLADGRMLLASGGSDRSIRLWDPISGQPVGEPLTGHADGVESIATVRVPDGPVLLASGSSDATVGLWDPLSGRSVALPIDVDDRVQQVAAVPLPGRVLLATGGTSVRLLDPFSGRRQVTELLADLRADTVAAVPLPDGQVLLACGSFSGTIRLWDPITRRPVGGPLAGHGRAIRAITAVPLRGERVLLASGSDDGTIRLWDPSAERRDRSPVDWDRTVTSITVWPERDGRDMLVTASGGYVRMWDSVSGSVNYLYDSSDMSSGLTTAVAVISLPGEWMMLARCSLDGTVQLHHVTARDQRVGKMLVGHSGSLWAAAAVPLPSGQALLATAGEDGVRLWDPVTGRQLGTPLLGHSGPVLAVTALPSDGQTLLASGGEDGSVRLCDPLTGQLIGEPLIGHSASVTSVAAVPLGGRVLLASGSLDRTVRLWDPVAGGHPVGGPLTGHTGWVWALAALPGHGRTWLVSGSQDGTVRLWDPLERLWGQLDQRPVRVLRLGIPVRCLAAVDSALAVGSDAGIMLLDLL